MYSLTLINSILQKQQKKSIITVRDLKHGYQQMPLHEDSRPRTAMSTPLRPMRWKVVPLVPKNGNAAFQRMMEDLLQPVEDCADPFLDDIFIGPRDEDRTDDSSSRRMRRTCAEFLWTLTSTTCCASQQRLHSL